jgi:hypothetical protein
VLCCARRAGIEVWTKETALLPVTRPPAEMQELVTLGVRVAHDGQARLSNEEAREWSALVARGAEWRSSQAEGQVEEGAARTVRLLHFLVDGVKGAAEHFWTTSIGIDAQGANTVYFEGDWPVVMGLMRKGGGS